MNTRRGFLGMLAQLPFIGVLFGKERQSQCPKFEGTQTTLTTQKISDMLKTGFVEWEIHKPIGVDSLQLDQLSIIRWFPVSVMPAIIPAEICEHDFPFLIIVHSNFHGKRTIGTIARSSYDAESIKYLKITHWAEPPELPS